jgi:hypothetical protein
LFHVVFDDVDFDDVDFDDGVLIKPLGGTLPVIDSFLLKILCIEDPLSGYSCWSTATGVLLLKYRNSSTKISAPKLLHRN